MSLEEVIARLRESIDRLVVLLEREEARPGSVPAERPCPEGVGGELLTVDQAARLLNVKKSWVYEQSSLGNIPRCKVGRFLRFEREKLLEWVRDRSGENSREAP